MNNRKCIIEARNVETGHTHWDSDYVGNESYTLEQARTHLAELRADPEWAGWELRIRQEDEDGCYCVTVS